MQCMNVLPLYLLSSDSVLVSETEAAAVEAFKALLGPSE